MPKIGIITYHFARNYGAILQCYALQAYLISRGCEVEVLDYRTERQEHNNSLHHKRESLPANLAVNAALLPFEQSRRAKERKFAKFEDEKLRLSPRLRTIKGLSEYVNGSGFDILVSGSDQVLNPKIKDFDKAFLFPFETDAVKASFAASMGSSSTADLAPYADALRSFNVLCVREQSDRAILAELFGSEPMLADDPVFLLDAREWKALGRGERCERGPAGGYVLGYFINKEASSAYAEHSRRIAETKGLPLIILNVRYGLASFGRGVITDAGPLDFLSLLGGASFICTDSFHGTAFSLIYGKPFVSFEPESGSPDCRKRDLLEKTGERLRSVAVDLADAAAAVDDAAALPAPQVSLALSAIRDNQVGFFDFLLAVNAS